MLMLPATLLRSQCIGEIKLRSSKAEKKVYLSNGCIHCDALLGRFFEHEFAFEAKKAFETEAEFKAEWGPVLTDAYSHIYRWWFDES